METFFYVKSSCHFIMFYFLKVIIRNGWEFQSVHFLKKNKILSNFSKLPRIILESAAQNNFGIILSIRWEDGWMNGWMKFINRRRIWEINNPSKGIKWNRFISSDRFSMVGFQNVTLDPHGFRCQIKSSIIIYTYSSILRIPVEEMTVVNEIGINK